MLTLTRERRVDSGRIPIRPTEDDREIFFLDLAALHRTTKSARGWKVLGDQHQAARLTVEAIHDRDLPAVYHLKGKEFA